MSKDFYVSTDRIPRGVDEPLHLGVSDITEERVVEWLREKMRSVGAGAFPCNHINVGVHEGHSTWFVHGPGCCEHASTLQAAVIRLRGHFDSRPQKEKMISDKRSAASELLREADELESTK